MLFQVSKDLGRYRCIRVVAPVPNRVQSYDFFFKFSFRWLSSTVLNWAVEWLRFEEKLPCVIWHQGYDCLWEGTHTRPLAWVTTSIVRDTGQSGPNSRRFVHLLEAPQFTIKAHLCLALSPAGYLRVAGWVDIGAGSRFCHHWTGSCNCWQCLSSTQRTCQSRFVCLCREMRTNNFGSLKVTPVGAVLFTLRLFFQVSGFNNCHRQEKRVWTTIQGCLGVQPSSRSPTVLETTDL